MKEIKPKLIIFLDFDGVFLHTNFDKVFKRIAQLGVISLLGISFAHANEVILEQVGEGSSAFIEQIGETNLATITQSGDSNQFFLEQNGNNNDAMRQHAHHRHQPFFHNDLNFAERGLSEFCAVSIQEPLVGLSEIASHQPPRN